MTNKGFISKMYKQLIQLNIKKMMNSIKKKRERQDLNSHSSREDTDSQSVHKKMLNIVNHQKNENQNHNELLSPHTCQIINHQKNYK